MGMRIHISCSSVFREVCYVMLCGVMLCYVMLVRSCVCLCVDQEERKNFRVETFLNLESSCPWGVKGKDVPPEPRGEGG